MFRTIRDMAIGAIVSAAVAVSGLAFAVTGQVPVNGFQTPDGTWLLGLAGGTNYAYQYGITAHAGGGQAGAFVLPAQINMLEVDTVASANDSVALPFAVAGSYLLVRNAAASNSMNVYANPGTNLLTNSTDTINGSTNSTAYAVGGQNVAIFFAAKNGIWSATHGS
jgi:hypothetical protein